MSQNDLAPFATGAGSTVAVAEAMGQVLATRGLLVTLKVVGRPALPCAARPRIYTMIDI
jgi:hypothetical protein